jgi:hypothetical protein
LRAIVTSSKSFGWRCCSGAAHVLLGLLVALLLRRHRGGLGGLGRLRRRLRAGVVPAA